MIGLIKYCKAVARRIRGVYYYFLLKFLYGERIRFESFPICEGKINISIMKKGAISIGKKISIRRDFEIRSTGMVSIGNNCFFNNYCTIASMAKVYIGNDCIFGENVSIYDHNHAFRDKERLIKEQGFVIEEVEIGNNVWIGSNATILKGVHIGDNVVVGANCVVYKDVPDNTVVKGLTEQQYTPI